MRTQTTGINKLTFSALKCSNAFRWSLTNFRGNLNQLLVLVNNLWRSVPEMVGLEDEIAAAVERLSRQLLEKRWRVATAESCTAGWIAKSLTDPAGSSSWFECGVATYSNASKHQLLGVNEETLLKHGAVSEEAVAEMVDGAMEVSQADLAVAVSGIAGPSGGTADKPVGLVWFGWRRKDGMGLIESRHFDGDRHAVRQQTVLTALQGLSALVRQ